MGKTDLNVSYADFLFTGNKGTTYNNDNLDTNLLLKPNTAQKVKDSLTKM